jgi:hypothetical protein
MFFIKNKVSQYKYSYGLFYSYDFMSGFGIEALASTELVQ